ncbi:MAG: histidine--tRNA ligase [Bradyrhizobium sp.]|uniref:histidine--tRNA ligase n=1 Tax=Bradyrhizobium sp. TaxID=376 RepID=UPI00121CB377|nr:histidine--tRNA ligase [Bradyrhizobium sp.]THD72189.1 MAG: histidine--tRNA ligase [Bradyrhizobium sp.]
MADKPKKPQKLKARLPRGLADRGPAEIAATRAMVEKIREVFERYGFEPVETPAMEFTDALGKFLPDQDRPNEGVFSFQDDDEQWISLRYDLTAPLARYVAENFDHLPKPYRSYRAGYVYRNEKPGPGRFRQFMQFDADTVGSASPAADAEMCMMAADTMEDLGIRRGQYVVKVSSRKILDGLLESAGIEEGKRLVVLRAIDKHDRLGDGGVRALLSKGRKDDSGDFTPGADLPDTAIDKIIDFITGEGETWADVNQYHPPTDDEWFRTAAEMAAVTGLPEKSGRFFYWNSRLLTHWSEILSTSEIGIEGLAELRQVLTLMESAGYGSMRFRISAETVRGLEYYTGPVYEVELLLDTKDDKGRPVRFGSVGGGGRYDGLVSRFRGEPVPATGFSIGVSRLQAALTMLGKLDTTPAFGPVVVTVFDRDRVADYQKMVAALRNADIRAELYLGNPKNMGNQLKYADRRNSPCVIIQGSDEKDDPAGPQVLLKDLILGAELSKLEKDRDEYLQKQGEAQTKVPQASLVDEVRKILYKHGVKWKD